MKSLPLFCLWLRSQPSGLSAAIFSWHNHRNYSARLPHLSLVTAMLCLWLTAAQLAADEFEPLVPGKEGRNYTYKNLFRRGQDYFETYTIAGDQVLIVKNPISEPGLPQFMPEFSQKQDLLADFRRFGAEDFVELYFEMEDFPAGADSLYILNRLLQMKTMTGIQYFSTHEQQMTTYITDCHIVSAAKKRKEIAPPQFDELPKAPVSMVIMQDDNRFTATWYDVKLRVGEDGSLRLTMDNITPMYVQFIFYFKAMGAGQVRHEIVILPNEDGRKAQIYALSQIYKKKNRVLGIELDLGNSFNRRMSAVQGWISQRVYGY